MSPSARRARLLGSLSGGGLGRPCACAPGDHAGFLSRSGALDTAGCLQGSRLTCGGPGVGAEGRDSAPAGPAAVPRPAPCHVGFRCRNKGTAGCAVPGPLLGPALLCPLALFPSSISSVSLTLGFEYNPVILFFSHLPAPWYPCRCSWFGVNK